MFVLHGVRRTEDAGRIQRKLSCRRVRAAYLPSTAAAAAAAAAAARCAARLMKAICSRGAAALATILTVAGNEQTRYKEELEALKVLPSLLRARPRAHARSIQSPPHACSSHIHGSWMHRTGNAACLPACRAPLAQCASARFVKAREPRGLREQEPVMADKHMMCCDHGAAAHDWQAEHEGKIASLTEQVQRLEGELASKAAALDALANTGSSASARNAELEKQVMMLVGPVVNAGKELPRLFRACLLAVLLIGDGAACAAGACQAGARPV
jgi:hypothetical protein